MLSHLLPTYARADLAFERGEGAWLTATTGERYLDFSSGVAVNALGHAHPKLVEALTEQAQKLWHVSNLYRIPEAETAGAAALRGELCRRRLLLQFRRRGDGRRDQDGAQVSGRQRPSGTRCASSPSKAPSMAARWRRSRPAARRNISRASARCRTASTRSPFGDLEAVKAAITPETAAILIEPIQGEGGVRVVPQNFLHALRELCDQHGLLLVFDEVQTGLGRTGELFGYKRTGIAPDIMALAKALGGGFPIGALSRHRRSRQGHDRRHAWLDLRRQSARDRGRQCRARRRAGAGFPRPHAAGWRCC